MDFASEAEKFSDLASQSVQAPVPASYDPIALLEWAARSAFKAENESCKRKIILQVGACDDEACASPEQFVLNTYAEMCTRAGIKPKDIKREFKYVTCHRQKRIITIVFTTVNAANAFYSLYNRTRTPNRRVFAFTDKPLAVRLAKTAYQQRINECMAANPQARLHWGNGSLYVGDEFITDLLPFIAPKNCTCIG